MEAENTVSSVIVGEQAFALLLGDAFDLLGKLPAGSIDLAIISPPYWGLRDYEAAHNWDILDEWEGGKNAESVSSYEWYREHGGLLGLEPMPEWYHRQYR